MRSIAPSPTQLKKRHPGAGGGIASRGKANSRPTARKGKRISPASNVRLAYFGGRLAGRLWTEAVSGEKKLKGDKIRNAGGNVLSGN